MDREELRSDPAQRLTPVEFADASDLLTEIGKSQNVTVRRNLIVAWAELIHRSDDPELRQLASERLVEVVLETSDDAAAAKLTECAAQEFVELDDERLIDHAMSTLRATMTARDGTVRFNSATRFASALIRRRLARGGDELMFTFSTYVSQWRLSLSQWTLSLRDSLPVLLLAATFAAIVPLSIANLGSRYGVTVEVGNAVTVFAITMVAIALVSQISAVPAAALVRVARPLEALSQAAMCLAVLLFMKTALNLDVTELTFPAPETATSDMSDMQPTERRGPAGRGIWPYLGWIALGVFVSRWITTALAALGRSPLFASAAGATIAVCAAVAGAVLSTGTGQDGGWIAIVLLVFASAIGSSWADHRRGGRLVADEQRPTWRGSVAALVLLAGAVSILGAFRTADREIKHVQSTVREQLPLIGCGTAPVRVDIARPYRLGACPDGAYHYLQVMEPELPAEPYPNGLGSNRIDTVLHTYSDRWAPSQQADDPPMLRLDRTLRRNAAFACIERFGFAPRCIPPTKSSVTLGELLAAFAGAWSGEDPENFFPTEPNEDIPLTPIMPAEREALGNLRFCSFASSEEASNPVRHCETLPHRSRPGP